MERPRPPLLLQLGGCFVLLCCAGLARSLTITSPDQLMFEKAQGEKVTLPCTFELSEEDEGPLDIEWVLIPADNQKKEKVIVLYAIDKIYNYYEADRMQFTNPDPKSGDGSLDIQNLKTADTGTYQCKVKKAPGVQSIKIQLTVLGLARSLTITSPDQLMFEKAQGEKVTLPCTFELSEEDEGPLDIEWVLIPADNQKKEQTIIMYAVGRIYNDYYAALAGRLQFTNPDPKSGDGSLDIQNLKAADTGTYQCKVKKAPGVQSKKIQLTVLVKPARTKCSIGGSQEIGKDVTLKCVSQEGSPLLSYDWRRVSGTQDLPATSMLNKNTGELLLKNASQEYSGVYSCVASNRVGTDECSIELHVTPPVNTAGIIVGAIIGTLLGLSVLTFLICCWCKKHREKKYEKEVHHDIREDVPPPKSRSSTARSYIGSNRSSLGSMSPSNMEGYTKTPYSQVPSEDFERTPGQNPTFAPSKVAAPNLSRMGAVPVMIPAQSKDGSIV